MMNRSPYSRCHPGNGSGSFPCLARGGSGRGFALLAILWLAVILSIIAFSFAWQTRIRARATANILEMRRQSRILQSALEIGVHRFLQYQANKQYFASDEQVKELGADRELFCYPRYEPYLFGLEGEKVALRLVYPTGRFDLHKLDWGTLRRVLALCGVQGEGEKTDQLTELANAIKDWQDSDSLLRLGGAENDYYLSRDPAYYCKNTPLESLGELLLVKGMRLAYYAGSREHPGLVDLCNLSGENDKLDINCAPPEAFSLVDDLPEDVITSLLSLRRNRPILQLSQAGQILPAGYISLFRRYFDVLPVDYLVLTAWIVSADGSYGRSRRLIYQVSTRS